MLHIISILDRTNVRALHESLTVYTPTSNVPDLFHVYMNKCEFHFSRLHVNKINNFCFLLINGCVPCMTK